MTELWLFTSNHCPGCEPMKQKCEQISVETGAKLKVYNIDKPEHMALAKAFYIMSTPTLLIKRNGEVVDQIVGNVSLSKIEEALNGY